MFSFEERFRAFIANKVLDNMEILQEKRHKEFQANVERMLESDINKHFTNAEFKHYMDPRSTDSMLQDLVHQFIHRAVVVGHANYKAEQEYSPS